MMTARKRILNIFWTNFWKKQGIMFIIMAPRDRNLNLFNFSFYLSAEIFKCFISI